MKDLVGAIAYTRRVRLYAEPHWLSPFVFPVFVTLHEKGLPFETVEIDVDAGEHRQADFAARALTGKVPALEHEGFVVAESTAIVEWLEERFGPPGYPAVLGATPQERARVRQVVSWIRSDLGALKHERPTSAMFYPREVAPLSPAGATDAAKLFAVAQRLLPEGGDTVLPGWSIADAELTWTLQRLVIHGDAVPDRLQRYASLHWRRPSVRAFVEHPRRATP